MSKSDTKPWTKLELLMLNPWSENSIKNDSSSNKNDKLESLPKSPSATNELNVLPHAISPHSSLSLSLIHSTGLSTETRCAC